MRTPKTPLNQPVVLAIPGAGLNPDDLIADQNMLGAPVHRPLHTRTSDRSSENETWMSCLEKVGSIVSIVPIRITGLLEDISVLEIPPFLNKEDVLRSEEDGIWPGGALLANQPQLAELRDDPPDEIGFFLDGSGKEAREMLKSFWREKILSIVDDPAACVTRLDRQEGVAIAGMSADRDCLSGIAEKLAEAFEGWNAPIVRTEHIESTGLCEAWVARLNRIEIAEGYRTRFSNIVSSLTVLFSCERLLIAPENIPYPVGMQNHFPDHHQLLS